MQSRCNRYEHVYENVDSMLNASNNPHEFTHGQSDEGEKETRKTASRSLQTQVCICVYVVPLPNVNIWSKKKNIVQEPEKKTIYWIYKMRWLKIASVYSCQFRISFDIYATMLYQMSSAFTSRENAFYLQVTCILFNTHSFNVSRARLYANWDLNDCASCSLSHSRMRLMNFILYNIGFCFAFHRLYQLH